MTLRQLLAPQEGDANNDVLASVIEYVKNSSPPERARILLPIVGLVLLDTVSRRNY